MPRTAAPSLAEPLMMCAWFLPLATGVISILAYWVIFAVLLRMSLQLMCGCPTEHSVPVVGLVLGPAVGDAVARFTTILYCPLSRMVLGASCSLGRALALFLVFGASCRRFTEQPALDTLERR